MKLISEYISFLQRAKKNYGDIELYLESKCDDENCERAESLEVIENDEFFRGLYGVHTPHFLRAKIT